MCVDHAADLRKLAIEQSVRIQVARRTQPAFDDLAVKIGNDQVGGCHRGVIDAAGLDHHQWFEAGAINAADVAEGVRSQAAASDFAVGLKDLFAQGVKKHGDSFARPAWKAFTGSVYQPLAANQLSTLIRDHENASRSERDQS